MMAISSIRPTMIQQFRTSILFVLLAFIGLTPVYGNYGPCATDPGVDGYSSLSSLNEAMQMELNRIGNGEVQPQPSYYYRLCPGQVYDINEEGTPLIPVLSGTTIACGNEIEGQVGCIIVGGEEQVLIEDSTVIDYVLEAVTFIDITFVGFTGTSISATASANSRVEFLRCLWTEFESNFVVSQNSMWVDLKDCEIQKGIFGTALSNDGGILRLDNLVVRESVGAGLVATANEGVSFLQKSYITSSEITRITFTTSFSTTTVLETTVQDMISMKTAFYAQDSSELYLAESYISYNTLDEKWIGIRIQNSAKSVLSEVAFIGNAGVEYAFSAVSESSLSLHQVEIASNTGLGLESVSDVSALVMAIQGSTAKTDLVTFSDNVGFSGQMIALFNSDITVNRTCFIGGESLYVVFIDNDSSSIRTGNYVERGTVSQSCPGTGPRAFLENEGSGCFEGRACEGTCTELADEEQCLVGIVNDTQPVVFPTLPPAPSRAPTSTSTPPPFTSPPTPMQTIGPPTSTEKPSQVLQDSPAPTFTKITLHPTQTDAPTAKSTTAFPTARRTQRPKPYKRRSSRRKSRSKSGARKSAASKYDNKKMYKEKGTKGSTKGGTKRSKGRDGTKRSGYGQYEYATIHTSSSGSSEEVDTTLSTDEAQYVVRIPSSEDIEVSSTDENEHIPHTISSNEDEDVIWPEDEIESLHEDSELTEHNDPSMHHETDIVSENNSSEPIHGEEEVSHGSDNVIIEEMNETADNMETITPTALRTTHHHHHPHHHHPHHHHHHAAPPTSVNPVSHPVPTASHQHNMIDESISENEGSHYASQYNESYSDHSKSRRYRSGKRNKGSNHKRSKRAKQKNQNKKRHNHRHHHKGGKQHRHHHNHNNENYHDQHKNSESRHLLEYLRRNGP